MWKDMIILIKVVIIMSVFTAIVVAGVFVAKLIIPTIILLFVGTVVYLVLKG